MNPSFLAFTDPFFNILSSAALLMAINGFGLLLMEKTGNRFERLAPRLFFAFVAGASVTGNAVFALAAAGVLTPVAVSILLLLLTAASLAGWRIRPGLAGLMTDLRPHGTLDRVCAIFLSVVLAAGLLLSLTPEIGRDALVYHLGLPKLYLEHHGFYNVAGKIYANFPLHSEMLYTLGLFLRGDVTARLIHFGALLSLTAGIIAFSRSRLGDSAPAYLGALIFVTIPTVFHVAHMAYIDLFVALYTFAALWAYLLWLENGGQKRLVLCALCCGTAMSCKYTGLFLPLMGGLGVLAAHRQERRESLLKDMGTFVAVTALFGAPFYIKSFLVTGNPFYPFFYRIFGGTGWDPRQSELFEGLLMFIGMGRAPLDYLLLPWNVSLLAEPHTNRFDGWIGPLFLLAMPALALVRPLPAWLRIILTYTTLAFLFWASGSQQIRFMIPLLPFLAIATVYLVREVRPRKKLSMTVMAVAGLCIGYNGWLISRDFVHISPMGVVLGTEGRDDFVGRSVASARMYQHINSKLSADARLFLVSTGDTSFLCNRQTFSDTMFESYTMQKMLAGSSSVEDVRRQFAEQGFTHLLYDEKYFLGDKSMLDQRQQALFRQFRDSAMRLAYQDKSYRLYSF